MSGDDDRLSLSPSDRYVLRNLLDRHAREWGDKTFIVLSTGKNGRTRSCAKMCAGLPPASKRSA
ncbi:hypothetical protein [Bradyrhizobium sp. ISRA463]|uniref:hypothetical protein n=1 Tax=Bradyrhizobium sp. ISRA463 TaxID=2866199 RepID=UPI002478D863|nr:hypothetical protein [Bradyrhizobium sp. ISRA463]WGS18824.1 hypothetical protein MTX22_30510 [Bradyrhizobium sp. ISRA463]